MQNINGLLATSTADTVSEKISDAEVEIDAAWDFIQQQIPNLISFGIRVVLCFLFFLIGRGVIKWFRKVIQRSLKRAGVDQGVMQFVDSLLKFSLYTLLLFFIATSLGVESSSVAALLASGGVAIGLALQGSLSNLAGGVLILILKPFVVGDYIIEDTNQNEGTVKEIQIFYTKLSTVDNKTIVIPNGTLANNSLTNLTASSKRQLDMRVGISYRSDLKKAKSLLEQLILEEPAVLKEEEYKVFVHDLAESAVILGFRAWVKTEDYWKVRWQLLEDIKTVFDENGIEIPYHQLTVHLEENSD